LKISHSKQLSVENMVHAVATQASSVLKPYDYVFVQSLSQQISYNQYGLTEKQASLCLKILKKNINWLNQFYQRDVLECIENPTYLFPLRTISSQHKISYIPDKDINERIKLQFPYNEEIVTFIKSQRNKVYNYQWDANDKCWYLSLDTWSLEICHTLHKKYKFEYDSEFQNYFDQMEEIYNNLEKYVPMLDKINGSYKLRNVSPKVPEILGNDLLESLFQARRYGITSWSDSVEIDMVEQNIDTMTLQFLKHIEKKEFPVNLEEIDQKYLENLIKNLLPCLFFIPAGSELSKTQHAVAILKNIGIENSDISVLFRLPNDTNSNFNIFVRENGLNTPLTGETKAVFISQKIPKTFFPSAHRFKTAIMYNKYHAHYATRDFLKNFQNIIEITDKNTKSLTENSMDWLIDV